MRAFETLSSRGQVGRLRGLAASALAAYEIQPARLILLAHLENTTFRVDTPDGERYVLRIQRTTGSPFHPPRSGAEVRSEMAWLAALRRETSLAVPEPVPTKDGSSLTTASAEGVPGERTCVLLRWTRGRFLNAGLKPSHVERVGAFMAGLHEHAREFTPPPGFVRWRVADLDGDLAAMAAATIGEVRGTEAAALATTVLEHGQRARRELGEGREVFGIIHADFHQENFLFDGRRVRAIDFDDCGWGHFAYDLSTTLSELSGGADYDDLRAGLLRGYRAVRPLSAAHERSIDIFSGLRTLLLILWFIEKRDHPSFPDWEEEVDKGLKRACLLHGEDDFASRLRLAHREQAGWGTLSVAATRPRSALAEAVAASQDRWMDDT